MNRLTVFYDHIRQAALQENSSVEEICAKLTAAGITGVETDYLDIAGQDGEEFAGKLAEMGLPISSVYCVFEWQKKDPAQNYTIVLKRLRQLGIHNLLAIPGFLHEGQSVDDGINEMLPFMQELCDAAPDYGVNIIMEDYDASNSSFGTSDALLKYFNAIPSLGCAFDTGNFMFFGEDVLDAFKVLSGRITYVHCKDRATVVKDGETPLRSLEGIDMYSSPVGSGVIPMTEVLTDILSGGYTGPLAIEHFGSQHQLADILKSAEYLDSLLRKAGIQ